MEREGSHAACEAADRWEGLAPAEKTDQALDQVVCLGWRLGGLTAGRGEVSGRGQRLWLPGGLLEVLWPSDGTDLGRGVPCWGGQDG